MKNLFCIYLLFTLITPSCKGQQPHSLSMKEIPAFLEKHLGQPTIIDTSYIMFSNEAILNIQYYHRPDLSYKKIAETLAKGFNIRTYTLDTISEPVIIKMLPLECYSKDHIIYKIEFGKISPHSDSYLICISDNKHEITTPTK